MLLVMIYTYAYKYVGVYEYMTPYVYGAYDPICVWGISTLFYHIQESHM